VLFSGLGPFSNLYYVPEEGRKEGRKKSGRKEEAWKDVLLAGRRKAENPLCTRKASSRQSGGCVGGAYEERAILSVYGAAEGGGGESSVCILRKYEGQWHPRCHPDNRVGYWRGGCVHRCVCALPSLCCGAAHHSSAVSEKHIARKEQYYSALLKTVVMAHGLLKRKVYAVHVKKKGPFSVRLSSLSQCLIRFSICFLNHGSLLLSLGMFSIILFNICFSSLRRHHLAKKTMKTTLSKRHGRKHRFEETGSKKTQLWKKASYLGSSAGALVGGKDIGSSFGSKVSLCLCLFRYLWTSKVPRSSKKMLKT